MNKKKLAHTYKYFEKRAWRDNHLVCGIDEVGRGALAGPLVVCAAILKTHKPYALLKDSKELSASERDKAYQWIIKNSYYATAIFNHYVIDNVNIYQATLQGMKKAFIQLFTKHTNIMPMLRYVVVDAMPLKLPRPYIHDNLEIHAFNYGESISPSIAAASIVAKVTRDNVMSSLHAYFPNFCFDQHKGYGTKKHQEAIKNNKPSIIHRATFISNLATERPTDANKQQTLF